MGSYFNPHHPRGWRLDCRTSIRNRQFDFNPHHPRGWRPVRHSPTSRSPTHFNPHHPRGWRRVMGYSSKYPLKKFQSTPPSRVATPPRSCCATRLKFQSTPPSRVATIEIGDFGQQVYDFNPHHPRGWRQQKWTRNSSIFYSY